MVGQQVLWLWLRFSYRLCGMLPDRGHKFHSASTARPCEDPARSLPPPPVLMTPEPCHCCEKRPSIPVAGNSSQGLPDNQPKVRNSGRLKKRWEPTHHEQPCTLHLHGSDISSQADWLMQQTGLSCRAALSSRWILCLIPRPDGKRENSLSFMFYYHSSASLLIQATGAGRHIKISKH